MENKERKLVTFAAIDPYVETNIVRPTEKTFTGKEWVEWGDRNSYPDYLLGLAKECPTLRSIILGTTDFIVGDDVTIAPLTDELKEGMMNRGGDTIADQIRALASDYMIFGGFALQVIRSATGRIVDVYYIDIRFLRTNPDCNVFWYSEKWGATRRNVVEYPAFMHITPERWATFTDAERERNAASIVFVKNTTTQVYPMPVYAAAVKACETERCIDDFHLNAINNGFAGSMLVNFNAGTPTDAIREEVERGFCEKFAGHNNAGRIAFSWNNTKDVATTIDIPKVEDFGDRYQALAKHVRQQIFTAFRANPNLFGIPTENLGFSSEEYESAFLLYNRTVVKPVQDLIRGAYEWIYGEPDVLVIKPFALSEKVNTDTLATQLGVGGTQALMLVLESTTMSVEQKEGTLKVLFGLSENDARRMLGLPVLPEEETTNAE